MLTTILLALAALLIAGWAYAHFVLRGGNLSAFDFAPNAAENQSQPPSEQHDAVVQFLSTLGRDAAPADRKSFIKQMREAMDNMGAQADTRDINVQPVDSAGVKGEWVLAANSDPDKRLLYIHGGAFMFGSPQSHRTVTTKFARMLGVSVFALDYRLMPENKRLDCLTDCQAAYRWVLQHGPGGDGEPAQLLVAGDSAGGNLALVVAAWARDERLRAADAVIAIAPATDGTMSSPTLRSNLPTDPLLGPGLGRLIKLPQPLLLWFTWLSSKVKPADPRVSPVHGDLANLPPILIHASEAEMLLGDAQRYTNKATNAGSNVELATWCHMVHVWHVFEPSLPEAKHAFEHIEAFLRQTGKAA